MRYALARLGAAVIVAVMLLGLAIGALLFSDAPVRDIVGEVWRVFVYWWDYRPGERRRAFNAETQRARR